MLAMIVSSLTLIYSALFYLDFDSTQAGVQFIVHHDWNPKLGTALALGMDGFSYPMVVLACLLSWVSILSSTMIQHKIKSYYSLLLILETAMLGVFVAQDWSLFYVFWEATLIPLFFLIDRWGGEQRQLASLNFVLYTFGGSVFMLIALLVAFDSSPSHSFAFADMRAGLQSLDAQQQTLIFLGLLIGFGVKMPIFTLHGWLPLADVEAPGPVSILLSGILLKMGAYGLIRAVDMLPLAALALQNLLFALALIAILYGALLAWRQTDLKKMIAYSSISHMGVVLLSIAGLTAVSLTGAVIQMVAHGLVAAALFMLIGLLYDRTHSCQLGDYGGLVNIAPKFAFFLTLALFAGIGMPGSVNFIAELHIFTAGWQIWQGSIAFLALGLILGSVYHLRAAQAILTGSVKPKTQHIRDLSPLEMVAVSMLMFWVVWLGFFPNIILDISSASVAAFSQSFVVQ